MNRMHLRRVAAFAILAVIALGSSPASPRSAWVSASRFTGATVATVATAPIPTAGLRGETDVALGPSMASTPAKSRLYRTERTPTRTLRVAYPSGRGRMVLRTEQDWERSVELVAVSEDGNVSTFALEADQPFLYFKPCLVESGATHWAVGPNKLVLMTEKDARVVYPYFFGPEVGRFSRARGAAVEDPRARPQGPRLPAARVRREHPHPLPGRSTCRTGRTSSSPTRPSAATTGRSRRPATSSTR